MRSMVPARSTFVPALVLALVGDAFGCARPMSNRPPTQEMTPPPTQMPSSPEVPAMSEAVPVVEPRNQLAPRT